MGLGITGTEDFSEFHIVRLRVIRARKVSPQEIRQLITEDMSYESIIDYLRSKANMLTHAMVGRFEPEVVGNFTLTREIHEGDALWRGVINVGNESYTNTFIFSQPTARWMAPAAN
jgi:hypothetical protein